MCGIACVVGENGWRLLLRTSLPEALERFFGATDIPEKSTGLAATHGKTIGVLKHAVGVEQFRALFILKPLWEKRMFTESRTCVFHVRDPAEGMPFGHERFAHPFLSCDGTLAVAHNGVIDAETVKKMRAKTTVHTYESRVDGKIVDTEAALHYVEQQLQDGAGLVDALHALFEEALKDKQAGYLAFLHSGEEKVYLAHQINRAGNTLCIARGQGTTIAATVRPRPLGSFRRVPTENVIPPGFAEQFTIEKPGIYVLERKGIRST